MIADADVVLATVLREDYERIFKVDEVMDWIQQFWNLVCLESLGHAADENSGDKVTFSAYCELHKRISKTIQEDFDAEEEKDIEKSILLKNLERYNVEIVAEFNNEKIVLIDNRRFRQGEYLNSDILIDRIENDQITFRNGSTTVTRNVGN